MIDIDARRPSRRRDETGMTTAEYAVGTVGACSLAAVLVHLGGDDWFLGLVRDLLSRALEPRALFDVLGIGVPGGGIRGPR